MKKETLARVLWAVGQGLMMLAIVSALGMRVWPFPEGLMTGVGFFAVAVACFLLMRRIQHQNADEESNSE